MYVCRKQDSEDAILKSIERCSNMINQSVIEHTAYIRASAQKKELDLNKFKEDVKNDMNEAGGSGSGVSQS